jgi:PKHD-type hydroxylase
MKNWYCVWENRLSPELCEEIKRMGAEIPDTEGLVGKRKETGNDGDAKENSRRSNVKFFDYSTPRHKVLFDIVFDHAIAANRSTFGFEIQQAIDVQYTKYLANEKGFYNWHEDITWCNQNMFQRKLSFSAQLSDPDSYEGGDLIFDLPEELCPPKESVRKLGTVIIFPSFVRHMVTPVTQGERHAMVSWVEGLNFR